MSLLRLVDHKSPFVLLCSIGVLLLAGCAESAPAEPEQDFTTPGTITKAAGDGQTALAGQPFAEPLRVVVFTPTGHKCNGCNVVWTLSPGQFNGGPVRTQTLVTGIVDFRITSLSPAGQYTVRATIDNGKSVDFTLTAR